MRSFDPEKFSKKAILFLQKTLERNGFKKMAVAVSGGIDSAVSLTLAVKALGRKNVLTTLLPFGDLNIEGLKRAKMLIKNLQIPKENIFEINIARTAKNIIDKRKITDRLRGGNIISRLRMTILFDIAKENQALVLGAENKSEHLLGYFTRFGDSASDIEIIRSLYKTEVYKLAKFLKVPAEIISVPPTAGLWHGQTDEKELGFSYDKADRLLYYLYEERIGEKGLMTKGYNRELIQKVKKQVERNTFKHKTPYVLNY